MDILIIAISYTLIGFWPTLLLILASIIIELI